jgi:glycosyltransferase involved in cell wall biosynthesis
MTAYNREKYIAVAIESVLASTCEDFELVVVDDSSQDGTLEIVRRYISDPRVQVHVNEKNLGDYPNRNRAATLARGKYLKYLDSDDVIYPNSLATMVEALEQFSEAAFALCRLGKPAKPDLVLYSPSQAYCHHFIATGLFHAGPSGSIIRAGAFWSVGGFTAHHVAGDVDLWLRLGARYPFVSLPAGLVYWRSHEGQEYRKGMDSFAYSFLNYKIIMDALADPGCPLTREEQAQAIARQKYLHARHIWHLGLREGRLGTAFRLYRDSKLSIADLARGLAPASTTGSIGK